MWPARPAARRPARRRPARGLPHRGRRDGGAAGLGPAINDKPLPVFLIKTQVRQGLGTMPAYSDREIDDGKLEDLVRYLKALRTLEG